MNEMARLARELEYARTMVAWRIVREVQEKLEELSRGQDTVYLGKRTGNKTEKAKACGGGNCKDPSE
jgi:hypothetical protein